MINVFTISNWNQQVAASLGAHTTWHKGLSQVYRDQVQHTEYISQKEEQ